MPTDTISATFEHLEKLTGSQPSLLNLLHMSGLWEQLQRYWKVFSREIDRRREGSDPIRALDFDLIYPTVWHAEVASPLELEERMGFPMTAAFIFRDTKVNFTIPPGSLFELYFHILRLEEAYNLKAGKLGRLMQKVERLHREVARADAEHAIRVTQVLEETLPECKRETDRLNDIGARLESLGRILTHDYYRPWPEISKKAGVKPDPAEIIKFWRIFSQFRTHPEKDMSNYLDALSMASYYALARAHIVGGDLTLLASGTNIILQVGPQVISTSEGYRTTRQQEIINPVSIQYLGFATAMERYAEYNLTRLLALTKAGTLGIERLMHRWQNFWSDCQQKFPLPENVEEKKHYDSISFSQLSEVPSFRLLCNAYRDWRVSFDKTVGSIFINITRADQQLSDNYHSRKQRLQKEVEELGGGRFSHSHVLAEVTRTFDWTPLTDIADSGFMAGLGSTRHRKPTREAIELLTWRKTGMLIEEAEVYPDPVPTLRTTIRLADIKEEILLVWERSVGHASQLCYWNYSSDIQDAFERIGELLVKAHSESQGGFTARLHVFARDLYKDKSFEVAPSEIQWYDEVLSLSPNPTYIRIDTNICTVFLDAAPPEDGTRLDMAVMYKKNLHRHVATLYRHTALFKLSIEVVEELLSEFAQDFKRKEPVINTLSGKEQGRLS